MKVDLQSTIAPINVLLELAFTEELVIKNKSVKELVQYCY